MRVKGQGRYAQTMSFRLTVALLAAFAAAPALGADKGDVPYWASLRSDEVNMRVGPGEDYKITWVYHRKQLPLKVVRLKESWRLVRDHAGTEGWMMSRFLTRDRTAVVVGRGNAEMRQKGDSAARLMWRVQPGVAGKLGDCSGGWCAFDTGGHAGYIKQSKLWGAGEP